MASLDTRVYAFNNLTFLVLAVMIAAIGVVATFGGTRVEDSSNPGASDSGLLVLAVVALVFGFSGMLVGSTALALKFDPVPRSRIGLASMAILGAGLLSGGSVILTLTATSAPPAWLSNLEVLPWVVGLMLLMIGLGIFGGLWYRATKP